MTQREVRGWIWPSNVSVLMRWLSSFVGYAYSDADADAINNAEGGKIEYPLVGSPPLMVSVAPEEGADPVIITVRGDMDEILAAKIDTLIGVLAETEATG